MQLPEGIRCRIAQDAIQSVVWQAMAHQDLYLAILKAWPTFQAPHNLWNLRPGEIWNCDVRLLDGWHSYWKGSQHFAVQAVKFHHRHARAALATVARQARVSKSWYRHCQAMIPPTLPVGCSARTAPLRLDIHRDVGPFCQLAFLNMPLDAYFHRTDLYLHRLAVRLWMRDRCNSVRRADPREGFLLYTINYYRHVDGDAGWHQHTYEMQGPDYARQGHSLQCLWFQMSHRIERQFESQIMPRYDMTMGGPSTW